MIKGLKVLINKNHKPNYETLSKLFDNEIEELPDLEYKSFFYFYGYDLKQYYSDKKEIQELLIIPNKTDNQNNRLKELTEKMTKAKKNYDEHQDSLDKKEEIEEIIKKKVLKISDKFINSNFNKMYNLYLYLVDPELKIPQKEFPQTLLDYFDLDENSNIKTVYGDKNVKSKYCDLLFQKFKEDKTFDFLFIDKEETNKNYLIYNSNKYDLTNVKKIPVNEDFYILDINNYYKN